MKGKNVPTVNWMAISFHEVSSDLSALAIEWAWLMEQLQQNSPSFDITEPHAFLILNISRKYVFSSSLENMFLFPDMFTAKESVHLCTRGSLSEMNKLNCVWNIVFVIASTALWLKHYICGADKSVRVSSTSPILFFKSGWCWKQDAICLGLPRYI